MVVVVAALRLGTYDVAVVKINEDEGGRSMTTVCVGPAPDSVVINGVERPETVDVIVVKRAEEDVGAPDRQEPELD